MRTPGGLTEEVANSDHWQDRQTMPGQMYSTLEFKIVNGVRTPVVHSLSGNERNKLFVNRNGRDFEDSSLVSGADSVADGRCFAIWDYDHDGLQDIALINMNDPHFQVFRNRSATKRNQFIAIRMVGGNQDARKSNDSSNRDGIGARVTVHAGEKQFIRELRCGEGFSSQNSSTLIIGIGRTESIDSVDVLWPSGRRQEYTQAAPGDLLVFAEPTAAGAGSVAVEAYAPADVSIQTNSNAMWQKRPFQFQEAPASKGQRLHLYITMATWCEACKRSNPKIEKLGSLIENCGVSFFGLPIDTNESAEDLEVYQNRIRPAYQILKDVQPEKINDIKKNLKRKLGSLATPCTVIASPDGVPIEYFLGIPTVSDILRILDTLEDDGP